MLNTKILMLTEEIAKHVLQADLLAGFTVVVMTVPQSLSYARIAGLPSQFGLYAAFTPVLCYAFFGSSSQLVTRLAATSFSSSVFNFQVLSSALSCLPTNSLLRETGPALVHVCYDECFLRPSVNQRPSVTPDGPLFHWSFAVFRLLGILLPYVTISYCTASSEDANSY